MTYHHPTRITHTIEHVMARDMFMQSRLDRQHMRTLLERKLTEQLAEQGMEPRAGAPFVHELFVLVRNPETGKDPQWVPFTSPGARGDLVKYTCSTAYVHAPVDATPVPA